MAQENNQNAGQGMGENRQRDASKGGKATHQSENAGDSNSEGGKGNQGGDR